MLLMQHTQTSFNSATEGRSDSTSIFTGGESDALEDLKLLDFPIYDDNFDDTSLDEMFSPGSSFDPTASTPTTPTTCSSYAPSPTAMAVTTSATDVDIVMTTVCHTPVSEVSSHAGSSLLPGFMETYSPRYRTATPSLNPMFFKFEDMQPETDASQSSSSFSTSVATSSQPMSLTGSPASRTSTATYPVANFLKQEPSDPFESQTTAAMPDLQQTQKRNDPKRNVTAGGKHHQIVSRFTSPSATFSSGRSSVSSVDNKRIVDSRTPLSSGSSSSTHSTMSPPLTPLTPTVMKPDERSAHVPPPHPHSGRTSSLCAVCGDNAACQHYGVRTCEGCKGFFKRTVQKGAKYVCLGSKDCVVDKRRRNRCQFCRFQKCLSVGMVKEVVRTDELKGRRGRLPSKPKSPQESPPSPPVSTITALVRAHLDTNPDMANTHMQQPEYVSLETIDEESVHQFYRIFESSLDAMRAFCDKCPGFLELEKRDQEILFQSALVELFVLRFAYRNAVGADRIVFCNGWALHRKHVELVMGNRWLSCIEKLSQNMQNIDIDISAFACLCALALVTDRQGLTSVSRIDQLQSKIISSLRDHCTYNSQAQKKSNYFSKILSILPELRSLSSEGVKRMQRLDQVIALPESLKALFSNASSSLLS